MALYGEIKVNSQAIWWWSAIRKEKVGEYNPADYGQTGPVSPVYEYEWTGHNLETGKTYNGKLTHSYDDGAVTLTRLVMDLLEDAITIEEENE